MNGTVANASAVVLSDPSWKVAFIADFNGDSKADLLWHNATSGQTVVWLMNGATPTASALLFADVQWQPVATPDLAVTARPSRAIASGLSSFTRDGSRLPYLDEAYACCESAPVPPPAVVFD